jgi:hypothetical protein
MRKNQQIIQKLHYELDRGNEVLVGPIAYYEVKRGYMAINAHSRLKEFYTLCNVLGLVNWIIPFWIWLWKFMLS